jgi:hypothetical protein
MTATHEGYSTVKKEFEVEARKQKVVKALGKRLHRNKDRDMLDQHDKQITA